MIELVIDGNSVTVSPEMEGAVLSALGLDPANPPKSMELTMGQMEAGATLDKAPAAPAPAAKADAMDALQARLDSLQAQLAAKPDESRIRESVKARIKLGVHGRGPRGPLRLRDVRRPPAGRRGQGP